MASRTFSATDSERKRASGPLSFNVEYTRRTREPVPLADGEVREPDAPVRYQTVEHKDVVTFDCWDDIPAGVLMDFLAAGDDDARTAKAVLAFLDACVVSEQLADFQELIRDPERLVPLGTLGEIAEFLAEDYNDEQGSGRPTQLPASSARGQRSTGRTSGRKR